MPAENPFPGLIDDLPVLFLWPFSGCDCRCVMCDIGKDHSRRKLDLADLERWLPEWVALGVRRVVLTGGEALLHPQIWQICTEIRDAGIEVELLSTGLTVYRHVENILKHCEALTLSLDGPRSVHNLVRKVPLAYDLMKRSTSAVRALDGNFEINGRCTVQRLNHTRLRETVDAAHELEFTSISFLATDVTSSAFNHESGWDEERKDEVALGSADLPALHTELAALGAEKAEDFASGFIVETIEKLQSKLLKYYTALNGAGPFPAVSCNAPWKSAVVQFDGTVQPCFFQPAYEINGTESFSAALNSDGAQRFRKTLVVADDHVCQRCETFSIYTQ